VKESELLSLRVQDVITKRRKKVIIRKKKRQWGGEQVALRGFGGDFKRGVIEDRGKNIKRRGVSAQVIGFCGWERGAFLCNYWDSGQLQNTRKKKRGRKK